MDKLSYLLCFIISFQANYASSLVFPLSTSTSSNETAVKFVFPENTTLTNQTANATNKESPIDLESTPTPTLQPSSPAVQKLLAVINSTILSIDDLIIGAMQNASEQGQRDFERVGGILRNVQAFLTEKGTVLSQDAERHLEKEVNGIQAFLHEHNRQLQDHFSSNLNQNQTTKTNASVATHKIGNGNHSSAVGSDGHDNGDFRNARGQPSIIGNLRDISSKMGESLRETVNGAENILTSSINQIQTQVQNIMKDVSDFFTNTGNSLQLPNLFNFTKPTKSPGQGFNGQQFIIKRKL